MPYIGRRTHERHFGEMTCCADFFQVGTGFNTPTMCLAIPSAFAIPGALSSGNDGLFQRQVTLTELNQRGLIKRLLQVREDTAETFLLLHVMPDVFF